MKHPIITYLLPYGGVEKIKANKIVGHLAILRWCFSWHLVHVPSGKKVWDGKDKNTALRLAEKSLEIDGLDIETPSVETLTLLKSVLRS